MRYLLSLAFAVILPLAAAADLGFSGAAPLNSNSTTDSGNDSIPRAASDSAGHWVVVWQSGDSLGSTIGTDDDILVSTSADNGATWSDPAPLNTTAATDASDFDLAPSIATDGAGTWICVWQSNNSLSGTIGGDFDILCSTSTDNGATWSAPAALNSNAATDSSTDEFATIQYDGHGTWIVAWDSSDSLGGTVGADLDILFARSPDSGATWSAPAPLNANAGSDAGADTNVALTGDGAGHWVAVWESTENLGGTIGTDNDVLTARSSDGGATWTPPAALNSNAKTDTTGDTNAAIATDRSGTWVAAWTCSDTLGGTIGSDADIVFAYSMDNGATWSAMAALNANASTDSGIDGNVALAFSGPSTWVAVWNSTDSLGGTIGTDPDIIGAVAGDDLVWSTPEAVDANAAGDAGSEEYPSIAVDAAGNCVALWDSNTISGATTGFDMDIFFATAALSGDNLALLAPNGGDVWRVGKKRTITWASAGDPGTSVTLELLRNGNLSRVIAASTANDGILRWNIPAGVAPGKGYAVRVTSTTDAGITDTSDGTFKIKRAK